MEHLIKMDDLGVPLFLETPICWYFGCTNSHHLQAFRPAKISHPVEGDPSQVAEEDAWPGLETMENHSKEK